MRAILLTLFSFFILLTACNDTKVNEDIKTINTNTEKEMKTPTKLLRHVVMFKFNSTATEDDIKKVEQEFAGLSKKIAEIHSFESGINNSPEGLNKGLTHCFFVTFLSEEDRDKYLPHQDHQAFVKLIGPYVEDALVVDYWTE